MMCAVEALKVLKVVEVKALIKCLLNFMSQKQLISADVKLVKASES